MSCIFCQIINREAPASIVYEDDLAIAFLDIEPVSEGHVLVIPKSHHARFAEMNPKTAGHLFEVAHKILKAIQASNIPCEGANLFLTDGEIAGQEVMHSHLHIAPRIRGDKHRYGYVHAEQSDYPRERLNQIADEISKLLNP
ncbi:HIT family protein [Bdellovibrio sp. HCB290]|uniref:HIT family protein n=1 Tax=Bdellovibrio sp. HCB290 TaxID=3394356 RepID=UPI0039B5BD31